MKVIGLTGVMGAGKSSVIRIVKELGITVFDCDQINAELLEKGNVGYLALTKEFQHILDEDGKIDKGLLASKVFQDETQKAKLEQIMHPLIRKELNQRIANCHDEVIVVEVPLLFEIGWEDAFTQIWCVSAPLETILYRLKTGRNITNEEAKRRLACQISQEEKEARSDVVLYNDGSLSELRKQIEQAFKKE